LSEERRRALKNDKLLITHGSTTAFVAEEVLGRTKLAKLLNRNAYISGPGRERERPGGTLGRRNDGMGHGESSFIPEKQVGDAAE
jgi:hypothetical protein